MNEDTRLWSAIYALYELLADQVNSEKAYQAYFEHNQIALLAMDLDVVESFEKKSPHFLPHDPDRGFRPEPDFIGANTEDCAVTIVDLKTPFVGSLTTTRSDGNRKKFKATCEQNVSQVTEYAESIRGSKDARNAVQKALEISEISSYKILLIYGMSEDNDLPAIDSLCSQRKIPTRILHYDSLLDQLLERYAVSRRDLVSRPGWSFTFHIDFMDPQSPSPAFLGEYGEGERNKLSVFLKDGWLFFRCTDRAAHSHELACEIVGAGPHHIRFEFSNDSSGIYMSLNVDNIEQDLRVGSRMLSFDPDTSNFTLGANSKGLEGARFLLFTHYFINRTLDFSEKLSTFRHFKEKTKGTTMALEFESMSYMIRDQDGNLIQPDPKFKPTLRKVELAPKA